MGLLKKIRKAKGKIKSFRGDGNALKSKFGIGRSLMNKFDARVGDALEDLLAGVTGVRTSNIKDIGGEVDAARQEARTNRIAAVNKSNARTGDVPAGSATLVFPRSYFNEQGDLPTPSGRAKKKTLEFPNSIHFRTLKRKRFDASEGGKGEGRESGGTATDYWNDRGAWGSVDPRNEPLFDIFLYLPHQLGDAVKLSYGGDNEAGMMETMFAKLFSFGSTDDEVKKNVGGNNLDAGEFLQVIKDKLPGGKIIQQATGALTNPMKFQLFEGVEFRDYSYKFTLKPSTKKEASEIRQIIAAFKFSALPGVAGENGRIWTQPNEWAIKFQGPIKNWIDFPQTVVCKSVEVDYSAGGAYTLMEDGSPQAIDMTLNFIETTQLSRQRFINQVSALMGGDRDFTYAERGTQVVDQELHRDEGMTVNQSDKEFYGTG